MRFLLINPFYPIDENPSPPLGIAFLAAALERADIEVRVMDLVVFPYSAKMLEDVISDFAPDVVGSTSVTMTFDNAIEVIKDVKRIDAGIKTVMGGPHVTFRYVETMLENPELDFIVKGEGEEAIVELVKAIESGSGFDGINGLVYRNGGDIEDTGVRNPGICADDWPVPARHLLPLGRYRALGMAISMTSSRGCPFNCIFCVGRKMVGAKVRYRDPVKVVDELEYLSTLGFHQINMADDLFTANKKHCTAVCDEIMRRGIKTKWTSFARVDTVSPEVLAKMKEAGCTAVSYGVESGVPEILKTIRKGITLDQVIEAVKMCTDVGMIPHASFILGLPGESKETVRQTVDFGEKIKAMGVSHGFHLLAPFPGTQIRDEAENYGLKILTDDWREYHANRAIVETDEVNKDELDAIVLEWEREFDNYLGSLKEKIESGTADEEEAWPLVNLERTCLIYDLMMDRVVEKVGTWKLNGEQFDRHNALETLIGLVKPETEVRDEVVEGALKNAFEKGNLRVSNDNGTAAWEWVDYL